MSNDLKYIDNLRIEKGDVVIFDHGPIFTIKKINREKDEIDGVMEGTDIGGPTTFSAEGVQEALVNNDAQIKGKDLDEAVKHY
jgi:AICAR transformylase/IMP cyclohydrolase PurH